MVDPKSVAGDGLIDPFAATPAQTTPPAVCAACRAALPDYPPDKLANFVHEGHAFHLATGQPLCVVARREAEEVARLTAEEAEKVEAAKVAAASAPPARTAGGGDVMARAGANLAVAARGLALGVLGRCLRDMNEMTVDQLLKAVDVVERADRVARRASK